MNITKKAILLSIVIILFFQLSACSNNKNKSLGNITVRIAYFPNINHSQALIAKAQGQFEKALGSKVKVEWKQFNSGTSEMEALFAGEVDLGYIGPGPAINGFVKTNGDIKIISGCADAGAILVCRNDVKINNMNDLSNKKIAVPSFGNTQDQMLRNLLNENHLKDTSKGGNVEIAAVNNSDVRTLFDKKQLDCAFVPEPWGSILIKECKAKIVLDYNQFMNDGNYPTTVLISSKKFIEKNKTIIDKIVAEHVNITDFINKHQEEAKQIVNTELKDITGVKLDKDILDSSFKRIKFTCNPEKGAIGEFAKLSYQLNIIKNYNTIKNIYDLDSLNSILASKKESIVQ